MKIRIRAAGPTPLTVVLEPTGMEYRLEPGDSIDYQWAEDSRFPSLRGTVDHEPSQITLGESGGSSRIWNSAGIEMSMF